MSAVDNLFSPISLIEPEELILAEVYRHPVVVKHLKVLALNETKELLSMSSTNEDSTVAKALAKVQGRLDILATLLSISVSQSSKE